MIKDVSQVESQQHYESHWSVMSQRHSKIFLKNTLAECFDSGLMWEGDTEDPKNCYCYDSSFHLLFKTQFWMQIINFSDLIFMCRLFSFILNSSSLYHQPKCIIIPIIKSKTAWINIDITQTHPVPKHGPLDSRVLLLMIPLMQKC